jgi:diguanylate cyclase (GGDEF)-like protein
MSLGSILIVSQNASTTALLQRSLEDRAEATFFIHLRQAFDYIYNNMPDLLICDLSDNDDTLKLLSTLKEDPFFAHLPVLIILKIGGSTPDWKTVPVEDYIRHEDIQRDIREKVELCIIRSRRVVEVNPLTRLPGNISINRQIQSRLDKGLPFALAYADLDHFKPFNDKYGFSRGDEVIKITGRLLFNIVTNRSAKDVFVGHIGGDDFVGLMEPALIEETCGELIRTFDQIVPSFYDPDDRETGYIQSLSREGKIQRFPIMSLSIGVAIADKGVHRHFGEVTGLASEMKTFAKKQSGSCYRINRRTVPA